mmetsp:Transcript_47578/g.146998  ORF Transcript_47578/g.146998 Transcript_47578/m.146998 type:complete len:230 (+) Transcript_47578:808-1497(+)
MQMKCRQHPRQGVNLQSAEWKRSLMHPRMSSADMGVVLLPAGLNRAQSVQAAAGAKASPVTRAARPLTAWPGPEHRTGGSRGLPWRPAPKPAAAGPRAASPRRGSPGAARALGSPRRRAGQRSPAHAPPRRARASATCHSRQARAAGLAPGQLAALRLPGPLQRHPLSSCGSVREAPATRVSQGQGTPRHCRRGTTPKNSSRHCKGMLPWAMSTWTVWRSPQLLGPPHH